MLTLFRVAFLLLIVIQVSVAQSVSRAYVGQDGNAHLVFTNGTGKTMPREPEQLGCEGIAVSADRKVVAWSVLVKNCCTSYPIPTSVVVYRNGKTFTVSTGQMIWQWHFVGNNQLALLSGPRMGINRKSLQRSHWEDRGILEWERRCSGLGEKLGERIRELASTGYGCISLIGAALQFPK